MNSSQILMYMYKSDHKKWNWRKIIKLFFYGMVYNICLPESSSHRVNFLTCLLSSAHLFTWNSLPTMHSFVQSHLCSRAHCLLVICCLSVNCKSSSTHYYLGWTWELMVRACRENKTKMKQKKKSHWASFPWEQDKRSTTSLISKWQMVVEGTLTNIPKYTQNLCISTFISLVC